MADPVLTAPPLAAPLPLASPSGGPWGPGAFTAFRDRLWLAGADRIHSARLDATSWQVTHRIPERALDEVTAEAAQKLGLVEDGPAAAALQTRVPGAFGIGPLQVLQAPGDRAPCLYAVTRSLWGSHILRSETGRRFDVVTGPAGDSGATRLALAGLACSGDWLITAPATVEGMASGKSPRPQADEVMVHARPGTSGTWQAVTAPGFGDGIRGGVTALTWAFGRFHVAVEDSFRGFELWAATPGDSLPWAWTRLIGRGGARYSLAPRVTAMAEFDGALYLATTISETGFGVERAGPAAAELLRVGADGSWEVIVGAPRFSPDGFKVPLSGVGPGFGDPYASMITCLQVFDGVLHAGTRNTRAEYILNAADGPPPEPAAGGAALWASTDGENWQLKPTPAQTDPAVNAVRGLCVGPDGGMLAAVTVNRAVATLQEDPRAVLHESELALEDIRIWR